MIYWQNRILTNVRISFGDRCKNVVSTISDIKATFPACAVEVVSNNSVADDLDIGSDGENAVYCGVAVEIYAKKSLQDSMELVSIANTAMYRMGFKRIQGPIQVHNASEPDIFHVSTRFARVIGASETIERFETP